MMTWFSNTLVQTNCVSDCLDFELATPRTEQAYCKLCCPPSLMCNPQTHTGHVGLPSEIVILMCNLQRASRNNILICKHMTLSRQLIRFYFIFTPIHISLKIDTSTKIRNLLLKVINDWIIVQFTVYLCGKINKFVTYFPLREMFLFLHRLC